MIPSKDKWFDQLYNDVLIAYVLYREDYEECLVTFQILSNFN